MRERIGSGGRWGIMVDIERLGTVEGLAESIDRVLANRTGVQALLIMSCADNGFTPD